MNAPKKWQTITGLVLHVLVAAPMLLAGGTMILGRMPADGMEKYGLSGQTLLIGVGEFLTALLLLIPRTASLGVLLTSAFWGGTICLHMSHGEPYLLQSAFLVLTWVGAYLRYPATFSSFSNAPPVFQPAIAPAADHHS